MIIRTVQAREKLYQELHTVLPRKHSPVKRVYIPKKKDTRLLGLPTIFDRYTKRFAQAGCIKEIGNAFINKASGGQCVKETSLLNKRRANPASFL